MNYRRVKTIKNMMCGRQFGNYFVGGRCFRQFEISNIGSGWSQSAPDGFRIDQNNVEKITKFSSELLLKTTFDWPRSSPPVGPKPPTNNWESFQNEQHVNIVSPTPPTIPLSSFWVMDHPWIPMQNTRISMDIHGLSMNIHLQQSMNLRGAVKNIVFPGNKTHYDKEGGGDAEYVLKRLC